MSVLSVLPLAAQERTDSVYTFRFVAGKDMFFSPYRGNDAELARLSACVELYRSSILSGGMPVYVDGYCTSQPDDAANLAMARIRSNRVKSEFITRQGLTENCFVTHNHAAEGNYVTVRITVPADKGKESAAQEAARQEAEQGRAEAERRAEQERIAAEQAEQDGRERAEAERLAREEAARQDAAQETSAPIPATAPASCDTHLSLRANLLRWATLTPDLGIGWRVSPSWGILVNGSWASWRWNGKNRRYALWEVAPEVRYYIGKEKRGYVGAMYKAGEFNYKFSVTGRQGDIMGGGITGGYVLRLNNALALDFSLGLGYIHADCEKYTVIDGVRVRAGKETKDWWGPVSAGVSLVWHIF